MSITATTMTTTMMMASNDIPSSDEVVGAAATGDTGATSLPEPVPWLFFVLSERHDRVLEVFLEMGVVRIMTLTVPLKFVSLSTKQWVCLMSVRDEINVVVEEIKRFNTDLNLYPQFSADYSEHIGDYYYVTVTADHGCVDIRRFYHPNGEPEYVMRATLTGVNLHYDEWAHLLEFVPTIHERHPAFTESCDKENSEKTIA